VSNPLALIVEDEIDIGIIFSLALQTAGFQTEVICSGDKALVWLDTMVPDIVILDVRLPYVSGVDILRQIRADPRLAKIPVIITTAYPDSAAFLQEQADLVLIKPVSLGQLRDLATRLYSSSTDHPL